ncbi:MAG: DUF4296 domain-containing protein [Psychroflexus sp.]|nr:DUF4296 domain-containing protein [Psychroflexus sp.]MDR9447630.1 DUF4296 domain-containing protein [Psychroflexus sp.]
MRYSLVVLVVMMIACQSVEKVEKPENLLNKEQMVNVLTDIAILKAATDVNKNRLNKHIDKPFQYIKTKYGIDSLTLAKNLEYYNFKFNQNLEIYEKVEEKLKTKNTKIDSMQTYLDSIDKSKNYSKDIQLNKKKQKTKP